MRGIPTSRLARAGSALPAVVLTVALLLSSTMPVASQPATPATSGNAASPRLSAEIPFKRDDASSASAVTGVEGAALALIALGGFGAIIFWRLRRTRPGAAAAPWRALGLGRAGSEGGLVQRVSSTRLSPRHCLHVVDWEGRRLLLGCTDQSILLLAETSVQSTGQSPASVAPASPASKVLA